MPQGVRYKSVRSRPAMISADAGGAINAGSLLPAFLARQLNLSSFPGLRPVGSRISTPSFLELLGRQEGSTLELSARLVHWHGLRPQRRLQGRYDRRLRVRAECVEAAGKHALENTRPAACGFVRVASEDVGHLVPPSSRTPT